MRIDRRPRPLAKANRRLRFLAALGAFAFSLGSLPAAEVRFNPVLSSRWYKDGNVQVVSGTGEENADEAISMSLDLPVVVSAPVWSFRAAYSPSRNVYQESEDANFTSHHVSLAYGRTLSERDSLNFAASGYRTQDQRIEPTAPDQPITFLPRSTRTSYGLTVDGANQVSERSDLRWEVGGSSYRYDDPAGLSLEDSDGGHAGVEWSYRVSERTSSGVLYRYSHATYEALPDSRAHTFGYSGSTETRRRVSLTYALGVIAADIGDGSGWYTSGGLDFSVGWSPRPEHSLSAGARQDVSPGRGLGGPTLDRGVYLGWSWSHVRGLGLSVNGGWWHREDIAGGNGTDSLYVSEHVTWGFNRFLRGGVFHTYRDQSDGSTDPSGQSFDTSFHSGGVTLTWTILGARERT